MYLRVLGWVQGLPNGRCWCLILGVAGSVGFIGLEVLWGCPVDQVVGVSWAGCQGLSMIKGLLVFGALRGVCLGCGCYLGGGLGCGCYLGGQRHVLRRCLLYRR